MLKELASIKDKNNLVGFVMYDGDALRVMDMDETKKYASHLNGVSTLSCINGELVLKFSADDAEIASLKGSQRRRIERSTSRMTLSDYVSCDSIIRKSDLDIAMRTKGIVLAGSRLSVLQADRVSRYVLMTTYFMAWNIWDKKKLNECLLNIHNRYTNLGVNTARNYSGFFVLNIPVVKPSEGFSLLEQLQDIGLNFIWNMGTISNNDVRYQHFLNNLSVMSRKMVAVLKPTERDLAPVRDMFRLMNAESERKLQDMGIHCKLV